MRRWGRGTLHFAPYRSEEPKHGIFAQVWLDALRGDVPENVRGLYATTARGRALSLTSLETLVDLQVRSYARKAGVSQKLDFPSGLFVSFEPSMPVFMPTGR